MTTNRELFLSQCKRRFGASNPERMRLEHWEWMVRHAGGPYGVRQSLGLEPNYRSCGGDGGCGLADPDWCFSRFGMTRTVMNDGRIICVGGEHEDWYDPDFCIYNDVIVLKPDPGRQTVTADSGHVEIYGYPAAVFPPTDFHSSTLVGDRLIIVGRLGYVPERVLDRTPVLSLDTGSFQMAKVPCSGDSPGWIYKHHASFDPSSHAITVRGGMVQRPGVEQHLPFRALHRLHLAERRWELVSAAEEFRMFLLEAVRTGEGFTEPCAEDFRPASVPHTWLPPEDRGCEVYVVDVSGVRITFEVLYTLVRVTVEGTLPRAVRDALLDDVLANLNQRDAEWELREVDAHHEW
jgi:hypothetical protein